MPKSIVHLPFDHKFIYQDSHGQPVSDAAALLQSIVCKSVTDDPLRVLDAGCGCGIIAIMLALQKPGWQIDAIDVLPLQIELAIANAALCDVQINFFCQDLRDCRPRQKYDLIVSNPPWQKLGSGTLSQNEARNIGRHELLCTMEDVISLIQRSLVPDGKAFVIYPLSREKDMISQAQKSSLDIIHRIRVPEPNLYTIFELGLSPSGMNN